MDKQPGTYLVNEIYYTIHGEGRRYGIPHVFVRFAQCNLACGFCDTEFESYQVMTADEILEIAQQMTQVEPVNQQTVKGAVIKGESTIARDHCRNVLFCGGEPLLQLDDLLIKTFKNPDDPWFIAVETNGTRPIPEGVDWSTCSPKVAEHAIVPDYVSELKYVRSYKQGIPRPRCKADYYLISPIFEGNDLDQKNLEWCIKLVMDNPQWALTVQHHKISFGGVR